MILGRPLVIKPWRQPSFLKLAATAMRALDLTLFELTLRDVSAWVSAGLNDINDKAPGVNVTVLQPRALLYETTEFARCREGVTYGRENFKTYNPAQLRAHFTAYPVTAQQTR